MNKNAVIAIVVFLLVISLGGAYFIKGKSVKNSTDLKTGVTAQADTPKSLKDLIGLSSSQKCTFDQGTMFIANGKVRGDFSSSHMIVDGTTSYIWTDGQTTGFKTIFDLNATPSDVSTPTAGASGSTNFDYNQKADYKCANWPEDSSVFELPKSVTFQDMSKLTAPVKPDQSGNSAQCGYCGTLSGDAKSQCLAALNCK